jgi:GT2 family glycosyltransferase
VKIFDSSINLGVGIGRNHLLGHTTEEWMVFLDNDIIVKTRSWVDRITCHIESFKDNEVFIPRLFNAHEHRYVPYQPIQVTCSGRIRGMQVVDDMINWFPGGASFVSRRLFERLGAYDERMFVGLEDLELGVRAIRSENPVRGRLIDDIELVHKHIGSKTDIDRQAVLTRYNLALIEASTKRLNEKHNVTYDDGWRSWAMEQLAYSMGRRRIVFELRWIFRSLSTKLRNRYWIRKLLERARAEVRI